jgi:glutamyl-tRNA reductase
VASDLFVVGINWRTAAVGDREKVAFHDDEVPEALAELLVCGSIEEAMLVSTCNRVEIYGATGQAASGAALEVATAEARRFLCRSRGADTEEMADKIFEHTEKAAVEHVFKVASALDSLVVGETQILGQLKAAYGVSVRTGATGPVLGRCLERAFGTAKRVRSETGISRGAANVSSVAVELARRVFGDLQGKTVLVVGAGKMSALAARHLHAAGAGMLLVTNRSPEKAELLADEVDGVARPWDQLESLLGLADVVISSTAAKEPLLTKKLLKRVVKARRYKPLVIIDIAVPRDAEQAAAKLDGIYLFDIDDLEAVVASNMKERAREAESALRIVDGEVDRFRVWLRNQRVVPTIKTLRKHFTDVARAEVEKALAHLPADATEKQRTQAMRRLGDVIVNKLLHTPMTALKSEDDETDIEALVQAAERLFDLGSVDRDTQQPPAVEAKQASAGKNRG